jgi:hypothetical protein
MLQATAITKEYEAQLPKELQQTYTTIVNERKGIYYMGYGLGFLLAIAIIFYNIYVAKRKLSTVSLVSIIVSVSFITNYFYYILSPKSSWMLDSIKDPEQTKAWLKMYRGMQTYYHGGLALGVVAMGLFAFAFRCY